MTSYDSIDMVELLLRRGCLSPTAARLVSRYVRTWGGSTFEAILDTHVLEESEIADALGDELKVDRVFQIDPREIDVDLLQKIPFPQARRLHCFPLRWTGAKQNRLEVVVANPTTGLKAQIEEIAECEVILAITDRSELLRAIHDYYPVEDQITHLINDRGEQ